MRHPEFPHVAVDRQHEEQGEHDEDFAAELAKQFPRHRAAILTNALTGHDQTLTLLGETLCDRLSGKGITEHLIRAALSCGTWTAGQLLLDLINKCIDDHADVGATVEAAGGMDFAAMRAAQADVRVPA